MSTGFRDGRPICGECGHTMAHVSAPHASLNGWGWKCIENTCSIGLAVLGDFDSAADMRRLVGDTDNIVDGWGFVHRHSVPAAGSFRLSSACAGCDQLSDATTFS